MGRRLVLSSVICWISVFALAQDSDFVISGDQDALFTDIELSPGDSLVITASGKIRMGGLVSWNGPEGSTSKLILRKTSGFPAGALLGAVVGEDQPRDYFLVGKSAAVEVKRSGKLVFFINEKILPDNDGHFNVSVEIHRAPALGTRRSGLGKGLHCVANYGRYKGGIEGDGFPISVEGVSGVFNDQVLIKNSRTGETAFRLNNNTYPVRTIRQLSMEPTGFQFRSNETKKVSFSEATITVVPRDGTAVETQEGVRIDYGVKGTTGEIPLGVPNDWGEMLDLRTIVCEE